MAFAHYQTGGGLDFERATRAVLSVGSGRGFVVESKSGPLIVTAATCLPFFPPDGAESLLEERTFQNLIGPAGGRQTIWAECLFADRADDVAVLGPPDSQELEEKYDAHRSFIDGCGRFSIANPMRRSWGYLLTPDGRWSSCELRHQNGPLWIVAREEIETGVSGSPILDREGAAIGVLAPGNRIEADDRTRSISNPRLFHTLPEWLISIMKPRFTAR